MSFIETFTKLCNERQKSPTSVCMELGLSDAIYTYWKKNGSVPRDATLKKIADYFEVSTEYLIGEESISEKEELNAYLEELKNRSEMRMLFSLAKNATKEDVEKAVAIIELLTKKNG